MSAWPTPRRSSLEHVLDMLAAKVGDALGSMPFEELLDCAAAGLTRLQIKIEPSVGSVIADAESADSSWLGSAHPALPLRDRVRQTGERHLIGKHERFGAERPRQPDRLHALAAEVMPRVAVAIDEAIDVPKTAKMRHIRCPNR